MEIFFATCFMLLRVAYVSLFRLLFSYFYCSHAIEHLSMRMILQTIDSIKSCSIFHFDFLTIQLPSSLSPLFFITSACYPISFLIFLLPLAPFISKIHLFTVNILEFHFCHCHSSCRTFIPWKRQKNVSVKIVAAVIAYDNF